MKRIALLILLGALIAAQPVDAKPIHYSHPVGCRDFWPEGAPGWQTCVMGFNAKRRMFGERVRVRCSQEVLLTPDRRVVRFIGYPFCVER